MNTINKETNKNDCQPKKKKRFINNNNLHNTNNEERTTTWPLLTPSSLPPPIPALHFGTKSLTIFIQRGIISRPVWSVGVCKWALFPRAIPVLFHLGPNKRKRNAGKVMEMLRKISHPLLFHPPRTPSLLRCNEPWKTLVLSSNRARDTCPPSPPHPFSNSL